jgi:hypothetical protein
MRIAAWCVLACLAGRVAHADDAAAKTLFDQGKALFAEGKYGEACAKLEASFKLSSVSSTRGMLGACYEKVGKLASAWAAYRDAAAIAERQGFGERAAAARDKATELEPKLARVTIDAAAILAVTGAVVTVDGIEQPRAALGTPLPIDAGPHVIEVTATDHKPWKSSIDIEDAERILIVVEPLVADPTRRLLIEQRMADELRIAQRRQLIAYGLLAGGGASVGVAVTLGLFARSQWQSARDAGCTDDGLCPTAAGTQDVDGAALKADLATYIGGAGLLLAGAGVFVLLTSPRPHSAAELRLAPAVSASSASVALEGRF